MREQKKLILLIAVSIVLLTAVFCSVTLLPHPGESTKPSPQTTASVSQTTSGAPAVTTRPTSVPVVTTTTPTVPQSTVLVTTTAIPTVPATTIPVTTVPVTTVPVTTVPPTTSPPPTVPPTTVPAVTVPAIPTPSSTLDARYAFVYDCNTDTFLCAKGSMTDRLHPASITKLFTIYTAYQYLDPSQPITVGTIIKTVPEDSSFAYLETGDVLTLEDLTAAMLLPSGNDAAMVMAVEAGRIIAQDPSVTESTALAVFMEEMNRQVTVLGLQNSHFTCPDGYYDWDHYSCMADLLVIAKHCLAIDAVRAIAAKAEYTLRLPDGRELHWKNTNWLVQKDSEIPCPYAIGLKTGYTSAAGNCLLSAFHIDGRDLIIGTFGCSSVHHRFEDTMKLFDEFA